MLGSPNRTHAVRAAAFAVVCVTFAACTLTTDSSEPSTMVKSRGDGQTAAVNTLLPVPLEVVVVNQFGEPLKDVTVNWTITSGGGLISGTPTVTDANGATSITYTTGSTSGTATINAQVHGLFPVVFVETIS